MVFRASRAEPEFNVIEHGDRQSDPTSFGCSKMSESQSDSQISFAGLLYNLELLAQVNKWLVSACYFETIDN